MQTLNCLTLACLLLVGIALCSGNVWYAAARSTIPLALQGTVTKKFVGTEKHPGHDDAYMIALDQGPTLCIDKLPFDAMSVGEPVTKQAWQSELEVSNHIVSLTWSRDFYGLIWCMLAAVVIMAWMIASTSSIHPRTTQP